MGNPCGIAAWDVVGAAPTMSALSGLISGFMFAGLIVLLVERQPRSLTARLPALTPFLSGFIALGLGSYLFSLISGEADASCRRVWAATAVASALLAIGSVAAVGGIVLLVHTYFDDRAEEGANLDVLPGSSPDRFLRFTLISVACTAELLLLVRVGEALWVWLSLDRSLTSAAAPLLIIFMILALFFYLAANMAFGPAASRPSPSSPHIQKLNGSSLSIMLFSTAGTTTVGAMLAIANGNWEKASGWVAWIFAVPSLGMPSVAIWLLVKGVLGMLGSRSESAEKEPEPRLPLG
ncbi:hypothetical protein [Micromonospora sp. WMMD708]|uniref:hypothetical protein n=1 Tax=Micromonospora sp. WMMD708 TaxID=3403464 RepID=UPI003BF59655